MFKNREWKSAAIIVFTAFLLIMAAALHSFAAPILSIAWIKEGFSAVQPVLAGDGGLIAAAGSRIIRLSRTAILSGSGAQAML